MYANIGAHEKIKILKGRWTERAIDMGLHYVLKSDWDKAEKTYIWLVEQNPKNNEFKQRLSYIHERLRTISGDFYSASDLRHLTDPQVLEAARNITKKINRNSFNDER